MIRHERPNKSNSKAIHICNSHEPTHDQKLQKSMSCHRIERQTERRKHIPPTKCINHWADSVNFNGVTINKLCSGLAGKCFEMPNASYTNR